MAARGSLAEGRGDPLEEKMPHVWEAEDVKLLVRDSDVLAWSAQDAGVCVAYVSGQERERARA